MIVRNFKPQAKHLRHLMQYLARNDRATLIDTNLATVDGASYREHLRAHLQEFRAVGESRPNLERAYYHAILRLAPQDGNRLTNDDWRAIAQRYLAGMGFHDAPFVVLKHEDAREHHIHIVCSRVTYDGRVISDGNDYRRSRRVVDQIEKDYDLRRLPARADRTAPKTAEVRQGTAEIRAHLQERIDHHRAQTRTLPDLLRALAQEGIHPQLNIASTGRVEGISFEHRGARFTGSQLGRRYTLGQLRSTHPFHPVDDLAGLRAYAVEKSAPAVATARPLPSLDDHRHQLRAQLDGLGGERFDLRLVRRGGGVQLRLDWSRETINRSLSWLREQNEAGFVLYLRPTTPATRRALLARPLDPEALARAIERGYRPTQVLRVDGQVQVIFRGDIDRRDARPLAHHLAVDLKLPRGRAYEHWCHAAGFRASGGELVAVERTTADTLDASPAFARILRQQEAARSALEIQAAAASTDPLDRRALHREAAARPLEALDGLPSAHTAATAADLAAALREADTAAASRLQRALAAPSPATEAEALTAYRDYLAHRFDAERLTGRHLAPTYPLDRLPEHCALAAELARRTSEERSGGDRRPAADPARAEAQALASARTADQLARFEATLPPLAAQPIDTPALLRRTEDLLAAAPGSFRDHLAVLDHGYRLAAARAMVLDRLHEERGRGARLPIGEHEATSAQLARALHQVEHRLAERSRDRLERLLLAGPRPDPAVLRDHLRNLQRLAEVESRLSPFDRRTASRLAESALGFERALATVRTAPTAGALRDLDAAARNFYRSALASELRGALAEFRRTPGSPQARIELHAAIDRHFAAAPASLETAIGRLRAGDARRENRRALLAHLVARHPTLPRVATPRPRDPRNARALVLSALRAYERAPTAPTAARLAAAVRAARAPDPRSPSRPARLAPGRLPLPRASALLALYHFARAAAERDPSYAAARQGAEILLQRTGLAKYLHLLHNSTNDPSSALLQFVLNTTVYKLLTPLPVPVAWVIASVARSLTARVLRPGGPAG